MTKDHTQQSMATDLDKLMIYMDPALKERFAELAKLEHRTMSKHAAYLIEMAVKEAEADGRLSSKKRTSDRPHTQPQEET